MINVLPLEKYFRICGLLPPCQVNVYGRVPEIFRLAKYSVPFSPHSPQRSIVWHSNYDLKDWLRAVSEAMQKSSVTWNLGKWYWYTYLKGRNGDTEVEDALVDTMGEGDSGTNDEGSFNMHTISCIKQIADGKLLCNTGGAAWWSVMTPRGGVGEEREAQEEGGICIIMASSPCCMAEPNTTP